MKKLARIGLIVVMLFVWCVHAGTPQVQNLTAKQRFPWNGLVDITCTVTGISGASDEVNVFSVVAVMPDSGNVRTLSNLWVVRNGVNSTDHTVQANGSYRLLWDAKADLGQVVYSNMIMRVTIDTLLLRDKVQLWASGPYWAGKNIGAQSPWEYGYYFWWGDTVGYKRVNDAWVASDGSSSNFSFDDSNTRTRKSIDTLKSEGWITADEVLTPEHDAAHVHWGGSWRMPTEQELSDLGNNCDWTWTTMNGVSGYVVRGRGGYASASIFLPCAGYGGGTSLSDAGSNGYYWSSVPRSGTRTLACFLDFNSSGHGTSRNNRSCGRSVRPVQGFTE